MSRQGKETAIDEAAGRRQMGAGERPEITRSVGLDVFRGVCVMGMILVTDPGTYAAVYPQLLHAAWRGATATDMIFPGFLFAVGAAVPVVMRRRMEHGVARSTTVRGIVRRTCLLIVIGLVLNAFPTFAVGSLRLPGVLQRIGLCYGVAALLYVAMAGWRAAARRWGMALIAAGLLLGYAGLLVLVPVPGFGAGHLDTLRSLPAYVDRAVFTVPHLWVYGVTPGVGVTFDPEGLLSTLPAIAAVLVGVLAGEFLLVDGAALSPERLARRLAGMAVTGVVLVGAGLALDPVMPLIKKLWTPSFGLLSSGVALLGFVFCVWLMDVRGWRRGVTMPLVFGTNAIAAFAFSGVLTSTLGLVRVRGMDLHAWCYSHVFLPWLAPKPASLLYAVAIVALNAAVIGTLYRRRIFLRL